MSYFKQKISEEIFNRKYCLHGEKTPEEVFRGVAKELSSVELDNNDKAGYERIYFDQLMSGKLMPGGRILANAREFSKLKNYNNCFTIDVEDSMDGITDSIKEYMTILKTGGGVGFNISKLRPRGAGISTGGNSSGVMSYLEIFDQASKTIQVGGGRRGASIAIMDVSHPDIEEFITFKQGDINKKLTQFNISVGITDEFIEAVKADWEWNLVFEGTIYKTVNAKYLYDLMVENAFIHNEPGILNLDTVERYNNASYAFTMDRSNPCGEIVMPPYSLCCLTAINLTKFVREPFTDEAWFDTIAYQETIRIGVRFLDSVLDSTDYPLEKIKEFSMQWRRIGLGFTGLGDTFAMMQMKYGSKKSKELSEELAKILRDMSYDASCELASEKGPMPAWDKRILDSNFIKELPAAIQTRIATYGLRNIGLNTVAPTGTISLTIGQNCSSGIEPIFSLSYDRNIRVDGAGEEEKKITERVYDAAYLEYSELFPDKDLPDYFTTTADIDAKDALDIQAIWQKYIDHSISKTHNLKPGTTLDEYKDFFMYAYDNGLKGFTSFNPEGSLKGILEYSGDNKTERIYPKRPDEVPCFIHETKVKGESFIVLIGIVDDKPFEIFATENTDGAINLEKNKKGMIVKRKGGVYDLVIEDEKKSLVLKNISKTFDKMHGTLTRFISMAFRHGTEIQFIVDQLDKGQLTSFDKALARQIKKYISADEKVLTSDKCPDCGAELVFVEGCKSCSAVCGWSKCG